MSRKTPATAQDGIQTWQKRIADPKKAHLAPEFIESLELTAHASQRDVEDLWQMWNVYNDTCDECDQSGFFREFVEWNHLTGAGPLK